MKVHILHRILLIPLTLLGVTYVVYSVLKGDVRDYEGYAAWLGVDGQEMGLLQGNWGYSEHLNRPVKELILSHLPVSLLLWWLAALVTYGLIIPLGLVKAMNHRGFLDRVSALVIFLGYALPGFALAMLLVIWLGRPVDGYVEFSWENSGDFLRWVGLPVACYFIMTFAWLTMMMKNRLMDEIAADYMRTAVAKGAGFYRAVFRHALRNSLLPVAASLGPFMTIVVSGSFLVEGIFTTHGLGSLQLRALDKGDEMLIMGTVTVASLLMITGKFVGDVLASALEPRRGF